MIGLFDSQTGYLVHLGNLSFSFNIYEITTSIMTKLV